MDAVKKGFKPFFRESQKILNKPHGVCYNTWVKNEGW